MRVIESFDAGSATSVHVQCACAITFVMIVVRWERSCVPQIGCMARNVFTDFRYLALTFFWPPKWWATPLTPPVASGSCLHFRGGVVVKWNSEWRWLVSFLVTTPPHESEESHRSYSHGLEGPEIQPVVRGLTIAFTCHGDILAALAAAIIIRCSTFKTEYCDEYGAI